MFKHLAPRRLSIAVDGNGPKPCVVERGAAMPT
jgi:hypothetical protein